MLKAPQRRLWWSFPHTDHLVVLRAQWSAAPPLVAQKAAAAEPSIRHRRWRLRAPSAHLGAAGAGRRQQALDAPNQPSRCFTGPVYRAASAPVRAHGCGEAAARQPPRRRSSAVRGGSCRSARAAARPAAGLSRDSRFGGRCARCAQTCQRTEPAAAAVPTRQPGGRRLPTRSHWLPALFGPPLPAVCSPMPPAGAALLLADNPPSTHLTNPEPLDGARHEVSAVRVRPSPPNPTLAQPLLVRFCSR